MRQNMDPPKTIMDHETDAARYLIDSGRLAFIWLSDDLIVTRSTGSLADWAPDGKSICDATILMQGFEQALQDLPSDGTGVLTLPNVTVYDATNAPPTFTIEFCRQAQAGGYLATLISLTAQRDHEFELQRIVRKHRERERNLRDVIEGQNVELERANKDLAAFAHLISHDLNAPMRGMRHALKQLKTTSADDATKPIADLENYVDRMSRMLIGLLDYAKIGHKRETIMEFNVADLIADILSGFRIPPDTTIAIDPSLPRIKSAPVPLDLIFRNLIDNALKYAVTDPPVEPGSGSDKARLPVVAVDAEDAGSNWIFTVSDNGPGIPGEMRDHIFRPFAQLAPAKNVSAGTGLGLSAVQRILETVGGRIEVTARNDGLAGSVFRFWWPKDIESQNAVD